MVQGRSMSEGYRGDLAYIHDVGFGRLAADASSLLIEELRRAGLEDGTVVDLCCGSGPLSGRMVDAGYEAFGVDISGAMIELARERVPEGRFARGSILSLELPPCVAVAAVGECFNYLFDEANTEVGLRALLGRIHAALAPGGVLIFDAAGPGRARDRAQTHAEGEGWAVLADAKEDAVNRVLTRRITTFRRVGKLYRRDEEVHRLRLLDPERTAEELCGIGFSVSVLDGYGEMRLPPGLTAFAARRGQGARDAGERVDLPPACRRGAPSKGGRMAGDRNAADGVELYFEDFEKGQVFGLGEKTLTKEEIVAFAREYDPQPFHVDEEAAEGSMFGGLIASGWHTAAVFMRLYADAVLHRSASMGSPGVEELRWLRPVRPGDTLTASVTVLDAVPSASHRGRGTVYFVSEVRNGRGETVMTMKARGLFARRDGLDLAQGSESA